MMRLLLVIYPYIGRLQTRDVGRQTIEKIVGRNYSLRIIFLHDCIHLSAREDGLDGRDEHVNIFQIVIERGIRHSAIVAPDNDPQSPGLNDLNGIIEPDDVVRRTSLYLYIRGSAMRG